MNELSAQLRRRTEAEELETTAVAERERRKFGETLSASAHDKLRITGRYQPVVKVVDKDRQGRSDVLHFLPWQWASAAVAGGSRRCGCRVRTCRAARAIRFTNA